MKRTLLLFAALVVPACGGGGGSGGGGTSPSGPNVVVIVADDLGYADLGVHGSPDALTPSVDSIAQNGVRCTNAYVSGPVCSPTRAGLMTGRYQQRFGHEKNPPTMTHPGFGLPLTETTIADRLRAAGYATGLVGKWHLGMEPQFHPQRRGFDEFFGFLGGAHSYTDWDGDPANPILRGTTPVNEALYLTDAFGREAVDFVDRHQSHPFFLYLAFNSVHSPMQAPARYLDRFPAAIPEPRRTYLAMLSAMDDQIGLVLAKLREAGLEENTLILFHSDNGGPESVNGSINDPLRGSKASVWEGGIRVPFLAQWKGRLPAGTVYDLPVIQLDVYATAVAAFGGSLPTDRVMDGVNLLPYFDGTETGAPHGKLFWKMGALSAIRKGDWKLVKNGSNPAVLYDLGGDVGETTDLAASRPDKVAELQADLSAWKAELVPPLW